MAKRSSQTATSARTAGPFGSAVRKRRKKAGLSQEQLAQAAGVSAVYVSMLERGQRHPTLDTVFDIAEALGVRPSGLVRDVEAGL